MEVVRNVERVEIKLKETVQHLLVINVVLQVFVEQISVNETTKVVEHEVLQNVEAVEVVIMRKVD